MRRKWRSEQQRSAAQTSAVLLVEGLCHTRAMARPQKSRHQRAAVIGTAPDDLYDYARLPARRGGRLVKDDPTAWTVKDDWPERVPVTEAEVDAFEVWFGNLFDELFATRH
jgi:hypothetical protein